MPTTLQIMPRLSGIGDIAMAAPAAAAAPAVTDAEPEPEPVVEEKTSFNVKLLGIDSSMKVSEFYILFRVSQLDVTKKLSNHDSGLKRSIRVSSFISLSNIAFCFQIKLIKAIKESMPELNLVAAKKLVESAPCTLR